MHPNILQPLHEIIDNNGNFFSDKSYAIHQIRVAQCKRTYKILHFTYFLKMYPKNVDDANPVIISESDSFTYQILITYAKF